MQQPRQYIPRGTHPYFYTCIFYICLCLCIWVLLPSSLLVVDGQCAGGNSYIHDVTPQLDCSSPGLMAVLPPHPDNSNNGTILIVSCKSRPAPFAALFAVETRTGAATPLLSECFDATDGGKFTYDRYGQHFFFFCELEGILYEIHPNVTVSPFLTAMQSCDRPSAFLTDPTRPAHAFILCSSLDDPDDGPSVVERLEDGSAIVHASQRSCENPLSMELDEERGLLLVVCQKTEALVAFSVLPPSPADWSSGVLVTNSDCFYQNGVKVVHGGGRDDETSHSRWVMTCYMGGVILIDPHPHDPLLQPASIQKLMPQEVCQMPTQMMYNEGNFVVVVCSSGVLLADFVIGHVQKLANAEQCEGGTGVTSSDMISLSIQPSSSSPRSPSSAHPSPLLAFDHPIFVHCPSNVSSVVKSLSGLTHTNVISNDVCKGTTFMQDPTSTNPTDLLATCAATPDQPQLISIHADANHIDTIAQPGQCVDAQTIAAAHNRSDGTTQLVVTCFDKLLSSTAPMVRVSRSHSSDVPYDVERIEFPGCYGSSHVIVDDSTGIIVAQCRQGLLATRGEGASKPVFEHEEHRCPNFVNQLVLAQQPGMAYVVCTGHDIWLVNLTSYDDPSSPALNSSIAINSTQCPQCTSMALDPLSKVIYYASRTLGVMQQLPNGTISRVLDPAICVPVVVDWDSLFSVFAIYCDSDNANAAVMVDPATGHVAPILRRNDCTLTSLHRDPYTGAWLVACQHGMQVVSNGMKCTAGYTWSQGLCTPCAINTHKPAIPWNETTWSIGCIPCPRGTIQNKTGSAMCDACPPGTYESNYACIPCFPGYWQGSAGQTSCDMCEAGYEAPNQGSSICNKCRKGHYAEKNGTAQCLECLPGRHVKSEGATICEECQAGFVATRPAATECEPCKPGHYSGSPGSMSCSLCSPGSFQSEQNATSCDSCEAGRFSLASGSTNCSLCASGSYSDRNASSFCQPCALGSASNETGRASSCPLCDAGFYSGGIGLNVCLPCQPSSYSAVPGAAECAECEQQVNANRTACTTNVCPANQEYSKITGKCVICPLGQYSSAGGSCTVCSVNSYTPHKGSGCISCLQAGMEGLICNGGLAAVREGWWAYLAGPDPATDMRLYRTQPCPHGYCPGSILQEGPSSPSSNSSQPSNGTSSTLICLPPRVNSLANTFCGQCEDGYIAWGDRCDKCDGADGGLLFAGVILSFLLVLFLLRAGTNAAGPIAILLYFVQIAALEVGPVSQWLTWLQAVNFDSASTRRCIAPWTPPQQTLATLLMPIILIVELGIIAAIHYCMHRRYQARVGWQNEYDETFLAQWLQGEQAPTAPPPSSSNSSRLHRLYSSFVRSFHRHRYLSGCISILLFCYTSIAVTCVRYLYCVDVDGHRILFFAPSIDCDSSEYKHYLIPVIVWMVVYVIAFPLIALIMLWRNRRSLYETTGSTSMPMPDVSQPSSTGSPSASPSSSSRHDQTKSSTPSTPLAVPSPLYQGFSPLFAMYAPHAWMYQPFVLLRRFAFALVSVLLIRQTASQFLSYALLHFASLQLHAWVQPYGSRLLNTIDTLSYSLLLVLSTMLTSYNPPYTPAVQTLLLLLIIPPAFILFLFILHQQFRTVHAKLKQKRQLRTGARPNTSGNDGNDDGIGAAPNTRTNETQQENEVDHESDHKSEEDEEYMHADRLELSAHPKQDRDRGREHYQLRRLARSMPTRATGPAPHVLSDADDEDDFPMHMVSIRM